MKAKVVVIILATLCGAFAQTKPRVKQDSLLDRARKGDDSALLEMEKSGDAQDLRSLLHDPDYPRKGSARLFLARMGDREPLQHYACRSLTEDLSHIDSLMRQDLDLIGGDFTIQVYRHLLDSDARFLPQIDRIMKQRSEHGGDVLPTLPSTSALLRLAKLVPDSPITGLSPMEIQASPEKSQKLKAQWRTWIDAHQDELKKLKPTANGINFDPSYCAKFKDAGAD